jgi:hypothetical protein
MTSIEKAQSKNPVTPTITRAAHALRKKLAEQYSVAIRFVSYGDCLKVAMGKGKESAVRDCFGFRINSKGSSVYAILTCDPEIPLMVDPYMIAKQLGMASNYVIRLFQNLQTKGFMANDGGLWNLINAKRPFPQPMA